MTDKEILGIDNRVVLGQLFKLAFGTTPIYMPFPIGKPQEVDMSGYKAELKEEPIYKDVVRQSIYGTPVVFPIMFRGGTFKKYDDKGKIIDFSMSDFWLPDATMVDFSRAKNIVKTNVLGSNGTVKEIYGFDDWNIRIRSLCIKGRDMTARDFEKHLTEWFQITGSIGVQGSLFLEKGITSIVLEDMDIKSITGSPDVIPIEFQAVSDEAIELQITKR